MRAVIQRVSRATVTVDGQSVGSIGTGMVVLLGVTHADTPADVDYLVRKITELRIFPDDAGKMNRSVVECGGALLVVSQFTLYADVRRGRRPGFDDAASPQQAQALYDLFVGRAAAILPVQSGRFGATMLVELANDGPVTLIIDSVRVQVP